MINNNCCVLNIQVCPVETGMDQDVVLRGGMVNIVPSPTGVFAPEDLAINTGSGVVIPKVSGEPNPTIQIQLTEESPVNVVLITLYGKKYDHLFIYLFTALLLRRV